MFKRTQANVLLRLLRLAASKDGPEAEAVSVLQGFLRRQSTEGTSWVGDKAKGQSQIQGYWQGWDVRSYAKVCSPSQIHEC